MQPSSHLAEVRYEIRGPLARRARELEASGRDIVHLNIGNPGRFGFRAPDHLVQAMAARLPQSDAYCQEQGIEEARAAVAAQQLARGARGVDANRVFIGNGVSELIDLALRALLNTGDEVLLPSPDYPLWSAATLLNGGRPAYYHCLASNGHLPDPDEMAELITPRTRAIVLINPNNPTGAVYPPELLRAIVDLAARHDLVLLSDEIYDNIVYDDARFQPLAALAGEQPCLSFGGLSKVHRACGFRVGWMSLSGDRKHTAAYRDALQLLAALRLCANVPAQWAVKPALEGPATIETLVQPGGRLHRARQAVIDAVAASDYLDLVVPQGALYAFPWVRPEALPVFDDNAFALRLLEEESVVLAPGSSFNVPDSRHLRLTLLPEPEQLADVVARMDRVLARMDHRSAVAAAS
jgi:alanine-synthesizing transaminase